MKRCAIILAAGSASRMKMDTNKVFIKFEEQSGLVRCLKTFEATGLFETMIVACKREERATVQRKAAKHLKGKEYIFCDGGTERQFSVQNALAFVPEDAQIVAVHDAARCFVTQQIIADCVKSAEEYGTGVAGIAATDTIKRAKDGVIVKTLPRAELVCIQTPQVFTRELIRKAYQKAEQDGFLGTDDASLVERIYEDVRVVQGSPDNIKITTRADLDKGNCIASREPEDCLRIGTGFDMHAFGENRSLVLGGVEIPYELGLVGHSDADVLVHAVMDALLGAAGMADIGGLFPDTDAEFKDIYSIELLRRVGAELGQRGFVIESIDSTLILQMPKVMPYRAQMIHRMADALRVPQSRVNVKATTTEFLGAVGRGEGAAAQAVCILRKHSNKEW